VLLRLRLGLPRSCHQHFIQKKWDEMKNAENQKNIIVYTLRKPNSLVSVDDVLP